MLFSYIPIVSAVAGIVSAFFVGFGFLVDRRLGMDVGSDGNLLGGSDPDRHNDDRQAIRNTGGVFIRFWRTVL